MVVLVYQRCQSGQRLLAVGNHSHVGLHVLVYLAAVDVQMNHLCLLGIGLQRASDTVAETHADGNEHIALLLFHVRRIVAVHAQHAHVQRMVGGQCRESEHRAACRNARFLEESLQFFLRIAEFHALPHESKRLLGRVNHLCRLTHSILVEFRICHVRTHEIDLLCMEIDHLGLRVLGEVEHHRTRATAACDVERTAYRPRDVLGMAYLVTPLAYRLGNTHEVNLLKGICSQCSDGHLSGNHHNRSGVHHGIGNARESVCCTRTTGDKRHTHLAADTCIALGSVCCALLMSHKYMVEAFLLATSIVVKGIINGHDGTAGIAEDGLHPFCLQGTHQSLRARYIAP